MSTHIEQVQKPKNLILNASVIIFVLTILSYAATVIYQQTFLQKFNIDTNILNLSIDPASIVFSGLILASTAAATAIIFYMLRFMDNLLERIYRTNFPIMGVFSLIFLISSSLLLIFNVTPYTASMPHESTIANLSGVEKSFQIVCFVLGVIYLLILATYVIKYKVRQGGKLSWFKALKLSVETINHSNSNSNPFRSQKLIYIFAITTGLVLLYIVTSDLALKAATTKNNFSEIITGKSTGDKNIKLVVGKSADGYIVKFYNTETKTFDESFFIETNKDLQFKEYTLK